jgi:hypothetical protein
MSAIICHKCQVRFGSQATKVHLVELRGDQNHPWAARPFIIWLAMIHECPVCGFKIVKIRDRRPLRSIIDADFAEVLAQVQTESDRAIVYTGAGE